MIEFNANFESFAGQIEDLIQDLQHIEKKAVRNAALKFWRQYRELIIKGFRRMHEFHERVPTNDPVWERVKTNLIGVTSQNEIYRILRKFRFGPDEFPEGIGENWLARFPGDQDMTFHRVETDEPWRATGTMERFLEAEWQNTAADDIELMTDGGMRMAINAEIGELYESYPSDVDRKLMERSRNSIGVMRLFVWQQKQLLDLLENDFAGTIEAIFASGRGR